MLRGGVFNFYGRPYEGGDVCRSFSGTAADRRKSYISACGRQFGRAPVDLGIGGRQRRGQTYGSCGHARLYSYRFGLLCPVSGNRIFKAEETKNEGGGRKRKH